MLRFLPLVVGILGGLALMINRFTTPFPSPNQSRSDVLGVIESALLILVSLLWQQVQPQLPESVVLEGTEKFELERSLPESVQAELAWASHTLLTNSVTKAIVVWHDGKILLERGILPEIKFNQPGVIVQRVLKTQKPVYLVKLALYPGKIEFDYLPANTQGVIVQPIDEKSVLILGANAPRSYTKQDENWVAAIAAKLSYTLTSLNPNKSD